MITDVEDIFSQRPTLLEKRREYKPDLNIHNYKLTEKDLDRTFEAGRKIGIGNAKLKDIVSVLDETYCSSIGVEYLFIRDLDMVTWLQSRFESTKIVLVTQKRETIYTRKLRRSVMFESFLQKLPRTEAIFPRRCRIPNTRP